MVILEDTTAAAGAGQTDENAEEALFREVLDAYGGGYGKGEGGKAAAYVCFDNTCSRPVRTVEALTELLA